MNRVLNTKTVFWLKETLEAAFTLLHLLARQDNADRQYTLGFCRQPDMKRVV